MEELGLATSDDVVLAFLQAEIDSPEYGPCIVDRLSRIGYDRSVLIDNGDSGDAHANRVRADILCRCRGYLFQGFPSNTKWRRVLLDLNDIGRLK
jgi:hypothetical protein